MRSVIGLVAGVWLTLSAVAGCPDQWLYGPEQGIPGVDGTVYAVLKPWPGWLVVAGSFGVAGDIRASNIAAWDGQRWHALGSGLGTPGGYTVMALAVYNGELIAGGYFELPFGGVRNVARWTGRPGSPWAAQRMAPSRR